MTSLGPWWRINVRACRDVTDLGCVLIWINGVNERINIRCSLHATSIMSICYIYIFYMTIYWFYQSFILFYICKYMYIYAHLVHMYIQNLLWNPFVLLKKFFFNHENCWWYKKNSRKFRLYSILHKNKKM